MSAQTTTAAAAADHCLQQSEPWCVCELEGEKRGRAQSGTFIKSFQIFIIACRHMETRWRCSLPYISQTNEQMKKKYVNGPWKRTNTAINLLENIFRFEHIVKSIRFMASK